MPSSRTACVVDASLVVRLLQPGSPGIVDLWQGWIDGGCRIHAPTLLVYEVTNALYRLARSAGLSPRALAAGLEELGLLDLDLEADPSLTRRAGEIAWALELPAVYDAHYLALAERLDATLWTCDAKLAKGVAGRAPRIRVAVPRA
jgi:predicted nucleic acid-binding protein